ncbi:hypothetical protein [Arthrobacter sp. D2-10]
MGFFDKLFGKSELAAGMPTSEPTGPSPQGADTPLPDDYAGLDGFDPSSAVVATEPWARKLVNYGNRVSKELKVSGVEPWPDSSFWVVAADVQEATWHVPVTNKFSLRKGWMREGLCSGKALLLLTNGRLVQSEFFGHFNFDEQHLSFKYEHSTVDLWRTSAWGANNFASWRDKPGSFGRVPQASYQEYWDGRWNYRGIDDKPPGLGTSLALKRFLETHKTQLPKFY